MKEDSGGIVFIDLPKKTSDILVSVVFQYGYLNEADDELGLLHLVEHLVMARVQKELGRENIMGTINDRKVQFDFVLNHKNVHNNLPIALESIFSIKEFDEKLVKSERSQIRSEIAEKMVDFHEWLKIQSTAMLIASPSHLTRNRFDQVDNIKSAEQSDVINAHRRMIKQPVVVCVGGYRLKKALKKEVTEMVQSYIQPSIAKRNLTEITWQKKKSINKYYPTILANTAAVSLIFPAPSLADDALERYAMTFVRLQLDKKLNEAVERAGIYGVEYNYTIDREYGFINFLAFVPSDLLEIYPRIFFEELERVKNDETLERELKEHLTQRKKNIREDWSRNYGRMGWVVEDMIDFGFKNDPTKMIPGLDKLTVAKVREVLEKFFVREKMYTLTITSEGDGE